MFLRHFSSNIWNLAKLHVSISMDETTNSNDKHLEKQLQGKPNATNWLPEPLVLIDR